MKEQEANKNQAERPAPLPPPPPNPIEWMRWIPLVVAVLVVGAIILVSGRVILIPLLCSLALAYMLEPYVEWFEGRGWSRPISVLLTLTSATLVSTLILLFLLPSLWDQLLKSYDQLPQALQAGRQWIEPFLIRLKETSPPVYEFLNSLAGQVKDSAQQGDLRIIIGKWLQSGLFKLVDVTASFLDLLLIPFFVYYLLSDYRKMRARVESLIPPRHRETAKNLLAQINLVLSSYVRSQLLIALVMGILYALGFALLRVPLALTLGLLSGLLNFIPYLGTLTGVVLSLSFVALDGAGVWRLLGVIAVFICVQSLEGYYLTPKLLGERLNLHPLWVLVALVIAGNLFGLLGLILAVPLLAIAKVVLGFLEELYQKSHFYRRPGFYLLTEQGNPVELAIASELKLSSNTVAEEPEVERQRRILLTTGELRTRQRERERASQE